MAFGSKRGSAPQRSAPSQNGRQEERTNRHRFPWVAAAVAAAVAATAVFSAAAMMTASDGDPGAQDPVEATGETVDVSRITGMDKLSFMGDDAKTRFAAAARDFLTERGYAWPCTVTIVGDAEQYKAGGTKFYFLTGEGRAWTVLYSPTAASEFSISELNTVVEGVNDEAAVAEEAEGTESGGGTEAKPKGSGYTSEDDGPAVVDARPSSSAPASGSANSGSSSKNTQGRLSRSTHDSGSSSSSSKAQRDSGSSSSPSAMKIAAGTVDITDEDAMETFLPRDAATVFPQAVSQYLSKWGISASKARACKGSAEKSGSRHTFNMTAGSHAAVVSYDATTHKFSFKTLY